MKISAIVTSAVALALVAAPAMAVPVIKAANDGGHRGQIQYLTDDHQLILAGNVQIGEDDLDALIEYCENEGFDTLDECIDEENLDDFEVNDDGECDDSDHNEDDLREYCEDEGFDDLDDCVAALEEDET